MSSSFAIAIVGHESRSLRIGRLIDAIQPEMVTTDDVGLGPGNNHDVAWRWLMESDKEWSVVIEDDALPVKPFRDQLAAVLRVAPTPVVSLYLGRARPPHWQPSISRVITDPAHFLTASELLHCVGVAMRTDLIKDMLSERDRRLPVDESIGKWARDRSVLVSYTHPSIVDHDVGLPSTIADHVSQHRGETGKRDDPREVRKAWLFGKRNNWEPTSCRIPDPPPVTPALSSRSSTKR